MQPTYPARAGGGTETGEAHRRRVDSSGLIERKTLEAFEWDFQPKVDKALVVELARLDVVRRREDLVITGKSGTCKSHVLKAFGLRACEQGVRMRYARCVDLLDDLHAGLRGRLLRPPTEVMGAACAPHHRRRWPRSGE